MSADRWFSRHFGRLRNVYRDYPSQFWVLVLGTFIDRLGGALLFPFFTLYMTRKFGISMTQVGLIFALFASSSVVGSMLGGALTDRLGRKGMLLFGLITSALSSVWMGTVDRVEIFVLAAVTVGLLADTAVPAQQAMVADLLPDEKRIQGYGILRIVVNLAVTIGPMIGGLLAAQSYLLLFVADAVSSLITAGIAYVALRESRPAQDEKVARETVVQTFAGYLTALRDSAFAWFLVASTLMVLTYMQINTTLAVYLRDTHGVSEQGFGYILSLNAAMVVLFQFGITRRLGKTRPLIIMAAGTLLYAVGIAMYGLVAAYPLFLLAMVIITIGEMFVSPTGQAIVARLSPADMRGRYMAVYGFSWVIPFAIGPFLAGLIMDNADPRWVWYGAGLLGLVAAGVFYLLEARVGRSLWKAASRRLEAVRLLEEGHISAVEAAERLDALDDGRLASLANASQATEQRYVRIRISDPGSGAIKADLRLPLGLVNTVLYVGGRLGGKLDHLDAAALRAAVSRSTPGQDPQALSTDGDERVEVSLE